MCLGDFVEIYGGQDNADFWDAVTTCFFIDTAPVVVEYIDVIYGMLRPGGVWINLGPLLYHWTDDVEGNRDERYSMSIEVRLVDYGSDSFTATVFVLMFVSYGSDGALCNALLTSLSQHQ